MTDSFPTRPLPGARFVKLGGRAATASHLELAVQMSGVTHLEVHCPDGTVLAGRLAQLDALLAAAAAQDCDYRVIGLAAENAGHRHVGIYADLVADEEASRRYPCYQDRYLTPPDFRSRLLEGLAQFLHPDDYCHRLREITAALAAAGPGRTQGSVKLFYKSALAYRAGELLTATRPLQSVVFVAKKLPSMQDSETLKFFDVSDPQAHLEVAALAQPPTLPPPRLPATPRIPLPPVPTPFREEELPGLGLCG